MKVENNTSLIGIKNIIVNGAIDTCVIDNNAPWILEFYFRNKICSINKIKEEKIKMIRIQKIIKKELVLR